VNEIAIATALGDDQESCDKHPEAGQTPVLLPQNSGTVESIVEDVVEVKKKKIEKTLQKANKKSKKRKKVEEEEDGEEITTREDVVSSKSKTKKRKAQEYPQVEWYSNGHPCEVVDETSPILLELH